MAVAVVAGVSRRKEEEEKKGASVNMPMPTESWCLPESNPIPKQSKGIQLRLAWTRGMPLRYSLSTFCSWWAEPSLQGSTFCKAALRLRGLLGGKSKTSSFTEVILVRLSNESRPGIMD